MNLADGKDKFDSKEIENEDEAESEVSSEETVIKSEPEESIKQSESEELITLSVPVESESEEFIIKSVPVKSESEESITHSVSVKSESEEFITQSVPVKPEPEESIKQPVPEPMELNGVIENLESPNQDYTHSESVESSPSLKEEPVHTEIVALEMETNSNEEVAHEVADNSILEAKDSELSEDKISKNIKEEVPLEAKPTPIESVPIKESVIPEQPVVTQTNEYTNESMNMEPASSDDKPVPKKRGRKASTQPAKSPTKSKSAAVPAASKVKTKRPYNRKTVLKRSTPVNVGEEVSILSSSSSEASAKESINIMSSSDSNPSTPKSDVSNLSSLKGSQSSGSLERIPSIKSLESSKSTSSTESFKSFVIDEWEKKACPSIFEKPNLLNPDKTYYSLKTKVSNMIFSNPEYTKDEIIANCKNSFSVKAIEQVIEILESSRKNDEMKNFEGEPRQEQVAKQTSKKSTANIVNEDFELLKKLSLSSSGRKRKIRSEEGDWIDPNEIEGRVISHEPAVQLKEKRKRRMVKKDPYEEDLNSSEDPFRLILLNNFNDPSTLVSKGDDDGGFEVLKAPFRVEMCTSVILLMDIHSHLHSSEIIGLLGGTFVAADSGSSGDNLPILRINFGYPCSTAHSTGTQVDVDPLSEMEAGEFFESKQVRMAGWYHSHPNFEPNPSLRDIETQIMYQGLFKNSQPESDIEPFVGVIVNPYLAATESSSHIECFYVSPNKNSNLSDNDRLPYRIPINRIPFNPADFPEILSKMREIVFKADSSPDRLDMNKNAQAGVKRIEKLFQSLRFHADLNEEQMEQVKGLFN